MKYTDENPVAFASMRGPDPDTTLLLAIGLEVKAAAGPATPTHVSTPKYSSGKQAWHGRT
jgi:hypothetical protein